LVAKNLIMYYTYVLRSKKNNKFYVGYSSNLRKRFVEHNSGLVDSTRPGVPWLLEYYEACCRMEKAIKREKELKTGFGRAYLKRRL
jgi:putative endonuclease